MFTESSGGALAMDVATFSSTFRRLIKLGGGHDSKEDARAAAKLVADLFDGFAVPDDDGTLRVDPHDVASGLSVLCRGSKDEKVRAAFEMCECVNLACAKRRAGAPAVLESSC